MLVEDEASWKLGARLLDAPADAAVNDAVCLRETVVGRRCGGTIDVFLAARADHEAVVL